MKKLSVSLDAELVETLRNIAFWEPRLTLQELVEFSLRRTVKLLEQERELYDSSTRKQIKKKGDHYPQRTEELRVGRLVR